MGFPHQLQREVDLHIDTADMTLYVKIPSLRQGRWLPASVDFVIHVAAKRHSWRMDLQNELRQILGDDDE